jgi:glutathione synthase/RimK-type ligase-like ATP-grasp enzyme
VDAEPLAPAELRVVEEAARAIRSPFFALDVIRAADGRVRVIESNDGGIATMPADLDPVEVYAPLLEDG